MGQTPYLRLDVARMEANLTAAALLDDVLAIAAAA